jgi:hypothetical protein
MWDPGAAVVAGGGGGISRGKLRRRLPGRWPLRHVAAAGLQGGSGSGFRGGGGGGAWWWGESWEAGRNYRGCRGRTPFFFLLAERFFRIASLITWVVLRIFKIVHPYIYLYLYLLIKEARFLP